MSREVSDPWGTHSISPTGDWLVDSIETLQGFPLNRFNWACENSHRIDIRSLPDQNSTDFTFKQPRVKGVTESMARYYLWKTGTLTIGTQIHGSWTTGEVVISWLVVTVFLLPYYMGLYHGLHRSLSKQDAGNERLSFTVRGPEPLADECREAKRRSSMLQLPMAPILQFHRSACQH